MIKTDQLRYFTAAARYQHIGKAAKTLAISAGSVCAAIKALEDEYQCKLFDNIGRRIVLTKAGEAAQIQAEKILDDLLNLQQFLAKGESAVSGHYRSAASHLIADHILAPLAAGFLRDHKDVSLEVFSLRSSEVLRQVLAGELDFGFCFNPQPHPDLQTQSVHRGQLLIYVHKKHPLLSAHKRDLGKAVSAFPSILPKATSGIDVCEQHPMLKKAGVIPNSTCAFDHYGIACEIARRTDGWVFLPEVVARWSGRGLVALDFSTKWVAPYEVAAVWRRKVRPPAFLSEFLEKSERMFL